MSNKKRKERLFKIIGNYAIHEVRATTEARAMKIVKKIEKAERKRRETLCSGS